jgi:lipopolysaccharide export LptBFGC system permease protein LptF
MNRPGPAGLLVLLAFGIVAVVELRTVLGMFGFEVPHVVYFPVAGLLLVAIFVTLLMLPSKSESQPVSA